MKQRAVESCREAVALRLTGCGGAVVGPVIFGGVRFWAGVDLDVDEIACRRREGVGALRGEDQVGRHLAAGRPPAVRLLGILVRERTVAQSLRDASLLAGYAPRSVLVDDDDDVLAAAVDAAVLDQGLVVSHRDGRLEFLAAPGPRVAGCGLDIRELALLETIYAAVLDSDRASAAKPISANR